METSKDAGSQGIIPGGHGGVDVREKLGMRRWMRLAARKHSAAARLPANDSAKAAAEAITRMMRESRRHA